MSKLVALEVGARQSHFSSSCRSDHSPTLVSLTSPIYTSEAAAALLPLEPERVAQLFPLFLGLSTRSAKAYGYHRYPTALCERGAEGGIWMQDRGGAGETKAEQLLHSFIEDRLKGFGGDHFQLCWVQPEGLSFSAIWRWRELIEELSSQPPLVRSFGLMSASLSDHDGIGGCLSWEDDQLVWSLIERREGVTERLYQRNLRGGGRLYLEQLLMSLIWPQLSNNLETSPYPKSPLQTQLLWWRCASLLHRLTLRHPVSISWASGIETVREERIIKHQLKKAFEKLEDWLEESFTLSLEHVGFDASMLRWAVLSPELPPQLHRHLRRRFPHADLITKSRAAVVERTAQLCASKEESSGEHLLFIERSPLHYTLAVGEQVKIPLLDAHRLSPSRAKVELPPRDRNEQISLLYGAAGETPTLCPLVEQQAGRGLHVTLIVDRYGSPLITLEEPEGSLRFRLRLGTGLDERPPILDHPWGEGRSAR